MDSCGYPYSSMEFSDECVFNEILEQDNYNTYSSVKYSGSRRTIYLALDGRGRPRRVALPAKRPLGKLSGYARALTRPGRKTLHTCTKHRQEKMSTMTPHHLHHTKRPCRVPKKRRKCKEGERPAVDNCEGLKKRQQSQKPQHKCPPNKPECAVSRNTTIPYHTRHKRPFRPKKFNKQESDNNQQQNQQNQHQQIQHQNPNENNNNKKKLKKPQQQKNKRKVVGRAIDDPHTFAPLSITSSSHWVDTEDDTWMGTSEEMLSSTQLDDGTPWEYTTNSGFSKEFFRQGMAVLDTAEEEDT